MVHRAKLTIGVHFCIKKLGRIKVAEDAVTQAGIAEKTLERVREKGIVVPPAVQKAIAAFAAKGMGKGKEDKDGGKGSGGKGKGKGAKGNAA